ncbi:MAG: hypothetical protein SFV51_29340 [Bryobacteraceae bacterium]|nr:hypothetical protein [Bryobacteraceae bacterium]
MNWRWYLALIVVSLAFGRWYFDPSGHGAIPAKTTLASAGGPRVSHPSAAAHSSGDRYREFPGGDGEAPDAYPTDVPLHPAARILTTVELPRPEWMHWNVVFEAEVAAPELEAWYRAQLREHGWSIHSVSALPAQDNAAGATVLVAAKQRRRLEIIWGAGEPRRTVSQTLVEPTQEPN